VLFITYSFFTFPLFVSCFLGLLLCYILHTFRRMHQAVQYTHFRRIQTIDLRQV
jgi:hypothetical protein